MKTKSDEIKLLAEAYRKVYEQTAGAGLEDFDERLPRPQVTEQEPEDITGDGIMDYTLPEKVIYDSLRDYNYQILNDYKEELINVLADWAAGLLPGEDELYEKIEETIDHSSILFRYTDRPNNDAKTFVQYYSQAVLPEDLMTEIEEGTQINILITDDNGKVIDKISSDEIEF